MSRSKLSLSSSAACLFACVIALPAIAFAQTKPEQKPEPSGEAQDVIKTETSLVQTDVMVFDKKGHPVTGLRLDQFQLKINKTPRDIAFFEAVTASAASKDETEPAQPNTPDAQKTAALKADAHRRSVIFFVDDLHLAPDSLARTRTALLDFIDNRVQQDDLVAITSPSGQIGFLQQFTSNKDALRSAVARLNYRSTKPLDMEKPPMSEYIALKIRDGDEQ